MKIIYVDGRPHREIVSLESIPEPSPEKTLRVRHYRTGAEDRLHGRPCASNNGDYLAGWYTPTRLPDFLTEGQQHAWYPSIKPLH